MSAPCIDENKHWRGCVGDSCPLAQCVFGRKPVRVEKGMYHCQLVGCDRAYWPSTKGQKYHSPECYKRAMKLKKDSAE